GQLLPVGCGSAVSWADVEPPSHVLPTAAVHRRKEYAGGRACALRALQVVGSSEAADLPGDTEGVPVWPDGMLGSITHSKGLCAAVAGTTTDLQVIGLDLERTDRLKAAAIQRIVHATEADFVQGDQLRGSILFSLKEAFYKAQFPQWRTTANFEDLALDLDLSAGSASVRYISDRFDAELLQQADALQFRFALVGDFVVSLCWLK
ncbi:MAG: 4'-phosphopantetheinyl transferase family protein, partial [Coraliomargarita sp.]